MYKNDTTGEWEHDWRVPGLPRYRACYGTKKTEAERLHAVAAAVFKARDPNLVHALKKRGLGGVTLEQYAQLRERGLPFADALKQVVEVEPWPAIGDAVARYVTAVERNENKSDGTARAVANQLNRWLAYQDPNTPLDAVATQDITDFQEALRAEGYAQNTVTLTVARVGSLYHWFIKKERIEAREKKRPMRELHVPLDADEIGTELTSRKRYLNAEEARRLVAATPKTLLCPVMIGIFAGLRIGEMLHLRTGFDVHLDSPATLEVAVHPQPGWKPKTKRSARHVPIAAELRPILEHHLRDHASEEWLLPSITDPSQPMMDTVFNRHLARIVADAELIPGRDDPAGVTYHTLRHTFASWLLMEGVDPYTVAKLLGNTVQQVENTYGHLSKDHRKLAVDKLSLKNFATSIAT